MTEHTYLQHDLPITEPANRIVSLVPSVTESLFDLNLGDRVVGVTNYCVRPEDKLGGLQRIGGTKNPDIQAIIDLNSDLIVANEEENRAEDIEAMKEAGLNVWATFPKTASDVFTMLWNIMYAFDETTMVPRIRLIEQTHDYVLSISEQREDDPCRVFAPIWNKPLMTFNADTYIHDLLHVCGGYNVFADRDERYPTVTIDEVVAAQPHVILLPSEPYAFGEADKAEYEKLDVPAAKNGMIYLVDGALLTWHGTRMAFALNDIPPLLCEGS